jgi:hypothetical protein
MGKTNLAILDILSNTQDISSFRMRWTGHVAQLGERGNAYNMLVGKQEGDHWEDQDVGG